jgi:uncharacterized cupin superfamily protein
MSYPTELLKAVDIAAMEGKSRAHLLNPDAIRVSKSLGAATGLTNLGFQMMTVMPGREYAGSGEAIIEERHYAIGHGDFLGFPKKGAAHTIVNTGDEPLVMLSARVNLEQDVCDYPRKKKRLYMNGAEEALVDFCDVKIEPPV